MLAALLLLPTTLAQETASATDAQGDASVQGVPMATLDILSAELRVNATDLVAAMTLGDAAGAQDLAPAFALSGWEYWIEFRYRDDLFHLVIDLTLGSFPDQGSPSDSIDTTTVRLYRAADPVDLGWDLIATGLGHVDRATQTLHAALPLEAVEASDGFTPGPAETITPMRAVSYYDEAPGKVHEAPRDPGRLAGGDTLEFPADAILAVAGSASGGLALSTPQRVRFSNGEATTYHWPLSISNKLSEALDLALSYEADPDTEVRAPTRLRLEGGAAATVDIFATVPFKHEHGGSRFVTVIVHGGNEVANIPLEIHYLDIPQPAGHHPRLFLHARNAASGQSGEGWMDTVEETDRDHDGLMRFVSTACPSKYEGTGGELFFALAPALLIGLDARTGEPATLKGTLDVPAAMLDSVLLARLEVFDPLAPRPLSLPYDEGTVELPLAQTLERGQLAFELAVPVPTEMDYMPPGGLNIGLSLGLCPTGPNDAQAPLGFADLAATVVDAAMLAMPLDEFHDLIPIATGTAHSLSTTRPQRRIVPGGSALWEVIVDADAGMFAAEVFGVAKDLATIHASQVRAGEALVVSLGVPADAREGDAFEIVLEVRDDGSGATTAIRLTAVADTANGEDDSSLVGALDDSKGAPALPLGVITAALLAIGIVLRRRA